MDSIQDAIAILGSISIAGLWGFCMLGGLAALWETFKDPVEDIIQRLKR